MKLVPKFLTAWSKVKQDLSKNAIANINQWARLHPDLVFEDNFKTLRQYLNDDTWAIVLDNYKDIKVGDKIYNMLPDKYRLNYTTLNIRNATDPTPNNIKNARKIRNDALSLFDTTNDRLNYENIMYTISNTYPESIGHYILNALKKYDEERKLDYYLGIDWDPLMYNSYLYFEKLANDYKNKAITYKSKLSNNIQRELKLDEIYPEWVDALTGGLFHDGIFLKDGSVNNGHFLNKLYRGYRKYINPIETSDGDVIGGNGATIIDLSNNALRATKNSNLQNILFNEFVETENPSIYMAGDIRNGKVKTFGDRKIPVENINMYAGILDGAFRTGPLSIFNDSTLVFPARNIKSNLLPITEFLLPMKTAIGLDPINDSKFDSIGNIYKNDGGIPYEKSLFKLRSNGTKLEWDDLIRSLNRIFNIGHPNNAIKDTSNYVIDYFHNWNNLYRPIKDYIYPTLDLEMDAVNLAIERDDQSDATIAMNKAYKNFLTNLTLDQYKKLQLLRLDYDYLKKLYYASTILNNKYRFSNDANQTGYNYKNTDGKVKPISEWNASILDGKFILANPSGGLFINRAQDISKELLAYINAYLAKHPSYVVRPDLGGFGLVMLDNPTLKKYISLYSENISEDDPNVYAVGTNSGPITDFNVNNIK